MSAEPDSDLNPEARQRERYRELLEELRVVLPGVQVLFAFLLTAPFSSRFGELDPLGRDAYFLALASAALSTVLLLTPTSYHRVAPRQARARRLRVAVRSTMAGMAALVLAMSSALFVVTRFVFGSQEGFLMGGVVILAAGVLWYVLPLRRRMAGDDRTPR